MEIGKNPDFKDKIELSDENIDLSLLPFDLSKVEGIKQNDEVIFASTSALNLQRVDAKQNTYIQNISFFDENAEYVQVIDKLRFELENELIELQFKNPHIDIDKIRPSFEEKYLEKLEKIVNKKFINVTLENKDKLINFALWRVWYFPWVDRVYIHEATGWHDCLNVTYQWFNKWIFPIKTSAQNLNLDYFTYVINRFEKNWIFEIDDVLALPEDKALRERTILSWQWIKAMLMVDSSIDIEWKLNRKGFFILDSITKTIKWSDNQKNRLLELWDTFYELFQKIELLEEIDLKNKELLRIIWDLEISNKKNTELTNLINHEVRNWVSTFKQTLLDVIDYNPSIKWLNQLEHKADHILSLVNSWLKNILDWTNVSINNRLCKTNTFFEDLESDAKAINKEKNKFDKIKINFNFNKNGIDNIVFDFDLFTEIFNNLVSNAIKYTEEW